MSARMLYFKEDALSAGRVAAAAGIESIAIDCHRFPDDELCLALPFVKASEFPETLVIFRSLARPNEKLLELMLMARHLRQNGVKRLVLVAPYLAYMRQDIAFNPGELVSQQLVGGFLAEWFDAVITVDPHLHRIQRLEQAIPVKHAITLSGAPRLAEFIVQQRRQALLIGPDEESAQWVESAAEVCGLEHGVCRKVRKGDREVDIQLPRLDITGRAVVLMDDIASSGHTLARAARQLFDAGAESVDVAVTHALFAGDALEVIQAAGVGNIWSTDCIAHDSNVVTMAPVLAKALEQVLGVRD